MSIKKSTVCVEFWRENARFADLFNARFYDAKEVIKAEDLQEIDTEVSGSVFVEGDTETLEREDVM